MNSPYRYARVRLFCSQCHELATSRCLRCGRPLCALHAHDEGTRCAACEREYHTNEPAVPASKRRAIISCFATEAAVIGASFTPAMIVLGIEGACNEVETLLAVLVGYLPCVVLASWGLARERVRGMQDARRRRFLAKRSSAAASGRAAAPA